jgi:hypothetical protein
MSTGAELVLCLCFMGLSVVLGRWFWYLGERQRVELVRDDQAKRDYIPPSHWTEEEMYGQG